MDIPLFFQAQATHTAVLSLWQKKLRPIMLYLQGSVLQKISASDEGILSLFIYKPQTIRNPVLVSIQKGHAGLHLGVEKIVPQAKPNGFVQVARKYLLGRKIISTWGSINPTVVVLQFAPVPESHPEAEEINAGPNVLIIDIDSRPPRVCVCTQTNAVAARYSHIASAFTNSSAPFFESYCEWSLESIKTKRRATFDFPLVGLCFYGNVEPISASPQVMQQKLIPLSKLAPEDISPKQKLAQAFLLLPPHVRRVAKTKYQFLERRQVKQQGDLPPQAEIERTQKIAQGLQANIYLWPPNSTIWYVPSDIISEFGLPVFFKLQQGQKPGHLLDEAFRNLERLQRRKNELTVRLKQSEQSIVNFTELLFAASEHIALQLAELPKSENSSSKSGDRLLALLPQKAQCEATLRLCNICDVPWIKLNKNKVSREKQATVRVPYREYFAFTGEFIRVSKSAIDADAMLKLMPSNHTWVHVIAGEGSHVWLERPRRSQPTSRAIREASILALHFSKSSKALSGEVHIATRGDIERKKNLPPGKVIINRSKSIICRYTQAELHKLIENYHDN